MTMERNKGNKRLFLAITIISIVILTSFGSFYSYWNSASPDKTCASCHEIGPSVRSFSTSSHRDLACKECHGTALSNGIHSMKEKGKMVVSHFGNNIPEQIRLDEQQMLAIMEDCQRCHASEFSNWLSSGHSATYADIFLDSIHNSTEQLNADCLRCHGMFFEQTTQDLVKPIDRNGPWKLINVEMASKPTIPCMACHQIHQPGTVSVAPDHSKPESIFYSRSENINKLSFYDRIEQTHVPSDILPKLKLQKDGINIKVSGDLETRNCVQCHAPDGFHEAGTSDDKTPRGVHEGIGCTGCHAPHSNDARKSCQKCHPAISNCNQDVLTMNTTYYDINSANDIHWVSCKDCHESDEKATLLK
jgi:hypothetical protein